MLIFLDTETTGVTPQDRIVSICWALHDENGRSISLVHNLIRPDGFTIPAEATAIHGITTDLASRSGVALSDALTALHDDIVGHAARLYVGHNVSFDRAILLNEYARIRRPEKLSALPTYCTMKSTTRLCALPQANGRGLKWPTLAQLHAHLFGSPPDSTHDARGDVLACASCYFELQRRGLS